MLLFMDCSFTLFELQKEGKNTEFNYKTKWQMSLNVSILKFYQVVEGKTGQQRKLSKVEIA